jgi:hypothetical protein
MPNPSPQAIDAIRGKVAALGIDWGTSTPEAILAALLADLTDNPAGSAPSVPVRFNSLDLATACSEANRPKLAGVLAGSAAALILAQDRPSLANGLDTLALIGVLSADDATAMKAVLDRVEPDPSWPAKVPAIEVSLGRPVDIEDILMSKPEA